MSEDLPNNIETGQTYKIDNQINQLLHTKNTRVPRGMSTVINNMGNSSLLTSYGSTNYQHQKTTLSGIGA